MTVGVEGEDKIFCWPVRIYHEDTDAAGIVYHANYLKFMERARTEWLRWVGYEQDQLTASIGILFVVRKIKIEYILPARFNDELTVVSSVFRLGRASLDFSQNVVATPDTLSRASVKLGCIDAHTLRPRPIPADIYSEIADVTS